jgi:UDPglucose 6-dehydrogenase
MRRAGSVVAHDPYVSQISDHIKGIELASSVEAALRDADVVFVATAHSDYRDLITPALCDAHGIGWVLDGRNCLDRDAFLESRVAYRGIGRS